MLPTCCELAGAETPKNADGISLVPTLLGDDDEQGGHEYLYWEFYEQGGKRAALWSYMKAVQLNVHKDPGGPIQLFDLTKDPSERNDIAAEQPDTVEQARKIFSQAHEPSEHWQFGRKRK